MFDLWRKWIINICLLESRLFSVLLAHFSDKLSIIRNHMQQYNTLFLDKFEPILIETLIAYKVSLFV